VVIISYVVMSEGSGGIIICIVTVKALCFCTEKLDCLCI